MDNVPFFYRFFYAKASLTPTCKACSPAPPGAAKFLTVSSAVAYSSAVKMGLRLRLEKRYFGSEIEIVRKIKVESVEIVKEVKVAHLRLSRR